MNWLDRYIIAPLAPHMALRRARARLAVKAFYEAAEPTRYRKIRTDRSNADEKMRRAAEPIRNIARHLDENFDIASGILDVLVKNVVGLGIQPEPQVQLKDGSPATDLNRDLAKLFDDWRFRPEVTWTYDYFALQRQMARAWLRDGEVFCQTIIGNVPGLDHGTIVPFSLEALEAEMVAADYDDEKAGIIQGIELSAWRRPKAYYVHKLHPNGAAAGTGGRKRILAEDMLHLAFRKRLMQVRGMSIFASVANRLDDIKEIDECERVAAKVAASMAAYIKKGQPDMFNDDADEEGSEASGKRDMSFEPGMIFDDLNPGEEIGTIDTKRPNNALIPFRDANMRAVAGGTGASYSSVSKNYDGTYSAQRQELVEHDGIYKALMNAFVYSVCQPVWDRFVDAAVLARKVSRTGIDEATLYDCTHTGPAMPWVDPVKEVDAQVTAMEKGLTSRSRVIRARGDNPDQIARERLRDRDEDAELGIAPKEPAQPGEKTEDEDEPAAAAA